GGRGLESVGVPVPALQVLAERVERIVGDDAVAGRRAPRDDRRVAHVGHGRHHARHRRRVRAVADERAQVRDLETEVVGLEDVARVEPVDGDDQERRARGGGGGGRRAGRGGGGGGGGRGGDGGRPV